MNTTGNFNNKERKGGLVGLLSSLFGSGSGSSIGAGGLFATKAGMLGVILGGATIAAGIGVIYNFVGSSSQPAYQSSVFQDSAYKGMVNAAAKERQAGTASPSQASSSSIEMFQEQAKKDAAVQGIDGSDDAAKQQAAAGDAKTAAAAADASAPAADSASGGANSLAAHAGAMLQKKDGISGSASGSKLSTGGGMFGGIGQNFQQMSKSASSAMKSGVGASVSGSGASGVKRASKAYAQAKSVNVALNSSAGSDLSAAKAGMVSAYEGGNSGSGSDLSGVATGGSGLGASGDDPSASALKPNSSLNSNSVVPEVSSSDESDSTPWDKLSKDCMYAMLAAIALIAIASMMVKSSNPTMVMIGKALAWAAVAAAAVCSALGIALMVKYKQYWTGGMYTALGAYLAYAAYKVATTSGSQVKAGTNNIVTNAGNTTQTAVNTSNDNIEQSLMSTMAQQAVSSSNSSSSSNSK
jgi:hypothetical protein